MVENAYFLNPDSKINQQLCSKFHSQCLLPTVSLFSTRNMLFVYAAIQLNKQ